MKLKAGQRLISPADTTTVLVIKAPSDDVVITCGDYEMTDSTTAGGVPAPASSTAGRTQLGKRYVDAAGTVELLCTKDGNGALALDGTPLTVKSAKPLPASD